MAVITPHSKVTLHFSLTVKEGAMRVDSTFDGPAASFVMGDGSLLPGFEQCLLGLQAGDTQTFELPPARAFGEINADSIHQLERNRFKGMALSEGLLVSFDGAGKLPMPGLVRKIDGDQVTVDFNHPLAGQTIVFTVQIVSIEEATIVKQ